MWACRKSTATSARPRAIKQQLPIPAGMGSLRLSKKLRFFDKGDCTPKGSRFSSKSCRTFWGVKCDFRCADNRKSRFKFYFAAACARRRVSERNRRLRRLLARRCGETLRGFFPASGGFLTRSSCPSPRGWAVLFPVRSMIQGAALAPSSTLSAGLTRRESRHFCSAIRRTVSGSTPGARYGSVSARWRIKASAVSQAAAICT